MATDMRTTRVGEIVVIRVTNTLNTTRVGLIILYREGAESAFPQVIG